MNRYIFLALGFLYGCSAPSDDLASAFPDLPENTLEIRFGYMPELPEQVCNRNLYAGVRSSASGPIEIVLDYAATAHGLPMRSGSNVLRLSPTGRNDLFVGQVPLFLENIESPCWDVHLRLLSLTCPSAENGGLDECLMNTKWQWLQGFKMVEIPKSN